MNKQAAKILIIDDEPDMLNSCSKILKAFSYEPFTASSADMAEEYLKREKLDLVLCDLLMPDVDGLQMLEIIKKYSAQVPVIIFSAYGTIDRAVACMKKGAFDFIEKPFEAEHLHVLIEKALSINTLYRERNNLLKQLDEKFSFGNIVGKSSSMLRIFEMIEDVSKLDTNIFITGESGTGKELIARSIHAKSKRNSNPFVPVNCGAVPENLFEAELFGYERGAFTSATQRKIGLLEHANTGTFFMDEVCELPAILQTKLLRVLQDGHMRRLGGNELIYSDLRYISATNKDIDKLLDEGKLREDFYYRLNVINIHVPPLRKRKEDIRLLAAHFLNSLLKKTQKNISGFEEEVLDSFEAYNWPGNVRELQNIVERAVAFAKDEMISVQDLPANLTAGKNESKIFMEQTFKEAKQSAVEEMEEQFLVFLLKKHNGNVTKLAEEAGMTRRNVYRLIKKYNIDPNSWR